MEGGGGGVSFLPPDREEGGEAGREAAYGHC